MRRATGAKVSLPAGNAARFGAGAQTTGWFDHLLRTRWAIYRCPARPKRRSWPQPSEIREMSVSIKFGYDGMPIR